MSKPKNTETPTPSQKFQEALELDGYDLSRMKPLTPIRARLIDNATYIGEEDPLNLTFLHSTLCQVALPRSKVNSHVFERVSGNVSLLIQEGVLWNGKKWEPQPIPYGTNPRLALLHICSEAVRTQSAVVDVGHSVREFLLKLGLNTGGRGYNTFLSQIKSLAACHMNLGITGETIETIDAKPIHRFSAWVDSKNSDQQMLWPGEIELTSQFYDSLINHAVPLDPRAIQAIKHSALAMDIYTWLAQRLCRINNINGQKIFWKNLKEQFGQEYTDEKNFKKKFNIALMAALSMYKEAKIESVMGGFLFKTSPPPIPRTMVRVKKDEEVE